MERVDEKSSPGTRFSVASRPGKMEPDPRGHAILLVRTYGRERALQIAQANRSVVRADEYWGDVFQALQSDACTALVAVASQSEVAEERELRQD